MGPGEPVGETIWGRGLVAFSQSEKATKPRPDLIPVK